VVIRKNIKIIGGSCVKIILLLILPAEILEIIPAKISE